MVDDEEGGEEQQEGDCHSSSLGVMVHLHSWLFVFCLFDVFWERHKTP